MFALAAPPANLYLGLWIGLAGFAFALGRERAPRGVPGALTGWAFGFGANVVAFRFVAVTITRFTDLPWVAAWLAVILLAAAQGLSWAACGAVHDWLVKRDVARPYAFALGAYVATFVPQVFPWSPAGGATPWPATVQLADLIGERGVTALMALAAGFAASAAARVASGAALAAGGPARAASHRRALRDGALALALPLATAAHGAWRMARVDMSRGAAQTAKIALVQPATAATERWDPARAPEILARLIVLTRGAESRGADLTVWPEAAYPYTLAHASRLAPIGPFSILGPQVRGPILTGVIMSGGQGPTRGSYNSAALVTANGAVSEPYDKKHLLWFGETVPLAAEIPWIRRTFARGVGLLPGERQVPIVAGPIRAAVLNCFEDTLPGAGREAAEVSPNLLVNLTNDAWFTGSAESELHLRLAVLRSIELRRDMVRAVNLGVTSWVDAAGRVRARYDVPAAGTLLTEPALMADGPTVYARAGDAPLLILLTVGLAVHVQRRRKR